MQTSPKPNFFDRHTADILGVSMGALAIVVFLSIAFVWFDATNLPPSNSTIGENNSVIDHGVIDHGVIDHHQENKQHDSDHSEDLVAAAGPTLPKLPFQFESNPCASLFKVNLTAIIKPDNTMWRCTVDGWQDISMVADPPPANKSVLVGVHPVIWTAMLLTASLLLLVMASSEEEIKKLLGRSSNAKKL